MIDSTPPTPPAQTASSPLPHPASRLNNHSSGQHTFGDPGGEPWSKVTICKGRSTNDISVLELSIPFVGMKKPSSPKQISQVMNTHAAQVRNNNSPQPHNHPNIGNPKGRPNDSTQGGSSGQFDAGVWPSLIANSNNRFSPLHLEKEAPDPPSKVRFS